MFISRKFFIAILAVCFAGGMQGAVVSKQSDSNWQAVYKTLNTEEQKIVNYSQLYALAFFMSMSNSMFSADKFEESVTLEATKLEADLPWFLIKMVAEKDGNENITVSFALIINGKQISREIVLDANKQQKLKDLQQRFGKVNVQESYNALKKEFKNKSLALNGSTQGQSATIFDEIVNTGTLKVAPASYFTWWNAVKAVGVGGALYWLYNKYFAAKPQQSKPVEKLGWFWKKSLPQSKPQVKKGWFSFGW